jgi:hypothetical protein
VEGFFSRAAHRDQGDTFGRDYLGFVIDVLNGGA